MQIAFHIIVAFYLGCKVTEIKCCYILLD